MTEKCCYCNDLYNGVSSAKGQNKGGCHSAQLQASPNVRPFFLFCSRVLGPFPFVTSIYLWPPRFFFPLVLSCYGMKCRKTGDVFLTDQTHGICWRLCRNDWGCFFLLPCRLVEILRHLELGDVWYHIVTTRQDDEFDTAVCGMLNGANLSYE